MNRPPSGLLSRSSLLSISQPTVKRYRSGTHRSIEPAETLNRLRPLLPALGITRISNVTGLDVIGIPVVMVVRPNSRLVSVSQGKGTDLAAAKASGLMEAIEGWHAEHIQAPLRLASFFELAESNAVVDVERLPRSKSSSFHRESSILWIEGIDLIQDASVWVPYEMVHTNFTMPHPPGHGCFYASTNGLASGNHLIEAISHAICELLERDALTIWHFSTQADRDKTRIDPTTIKDQLCRDTLDKFEKAGLSVAIWETTKEVPIPSFLCRIKSRNNNSSGYPAEGTGCHPNRSVALLRALTEAAQCRLTHIVGSRDDVVRDTYKRLQQAEVFGANLSRISAGGAMKSFSEGPTYDEESFEQEVDYILRRLSEAGFSNVIVVPLMNSRFNLPVVRVIIPGLENILSEENDFRDYLPANRLRLGVAQHP